ncbi:YbaK/EbsC family protein [Spiractinospora alimapuensis]|uniref:YbaK/EbsC family protein n=1 Tax=Spiractinospora alimapuensis TaxID=2820884 RepID=UPI001F304E60|nr:YbaK/EbsC family protein [Spiractinospora alimapuensis]QVQ50119.1 YbaK/EbsC family protein [Spiractinospora alimapuensis]
MTDIALHPNAQNIADILTVKGLAGSRVRMLPERAASAAEAARLVGCEVGAIANSLVFDADGEAVLVLASGAHRVDAAKAAKALEVAALRRATPDFVREATGQVIGGVSPVGHPAPLRTLIDEDLTQFERIWAAAGHPNAVFSTTYAELLDITGATPAVVA